MNFTLDVFQFFEGEGWEGFMCFHCFLSISLSFCDMFFSVFKVFFDVVNFAFQVAIYVALILLHSVISCFVPISWFLRFTLCSFDFASIVHAPVDFAAVSFQLDI